MIILLRRSSYVAPDLELETLPEAEKPNPFIVSGVVAIQPSIFAAGLGSLDPQHMLTGLGLWLSGLRLGFRI